MMFNDLEHIEFYDQEIMSLDGVFISAHGDVIIPVKHFSKFPWEKLNMGDSNVSSLSAGGHPLRDYEWTLNFWLTNSEGKFHPMVRQYRWCLPQGLVDFMTWNQERAVDKLQMQLKHLLGF